MKTITKEVKVVSFSIRNIKNHFKGRVPKMVAYISGKAKGFWARIKPKLQDIHNKISNKLVKMFENLADKFLKYSDKVLDKMSERLGLDPDDESMDGDTLSDITVGSGSINDMADIDG